MTSEVLPLPVARGTRRREADQTASLLERSGPEACSDEQLLAIMLGSGDPARRLARRLVDRFGSLTDVVRALNSLGATPQDLLAILQAMKSAGALNAELEVI